MSRRANGEALAVVFLLCALASGAAQGQAQARIASQLGDAITLSVGSRDGVREGMTGSVIQTVTAGGTSQRLPIARFEVERVDQTTCRARLTQIGAGFEGSVVPGLDVEFDDGLARPALRAPAEVLSVARQTYASRRSGYRYVAPAGWDVLRGEVRSPTKTLITIQVASLENADETFLANLPFSYMPQLEGWTAYYFVVDGAATTKPATLGGVAALEVTWPIRIRKTDPPGRAVYWVASTAGYLYVIRAVFPAGAFEVDEAGARQLLASWQFTEPTGPPEGEPPGTLVLSVAEPIGP